MGNDDKKKIGGIGSTKQTGGVQKTGGVSEVDEVKKAEAVKGASAAGGVSKRRSTRTMTPSERDALFAMIDEEAEKLFGTSELSEEHKEVARKAVKMAVDAATIDDES